MRTQDIVNKIEYNEEFNDEDKTFIKSMWGSSPLIKSEKYNSDRCPKCNVVILYKGNYCYQCGKKIMPNW